ncbi:hypothetical protein SLNSH_02820 [Alsobacter soli]|uniref:Uncharacterized protein n=1 Tax=Alsobacter soli TaxID=2109933 RepID=A0A2T1HYH4_9HYPH|nr:hypothetical protein [Alsobacter soli]PSC06746.1 hypothetical protein SLNSH_02820 [Alsobacter soli]
MYEWLTWLGWWPLTVGTLVGAVLKYAALVGVAAALLQFFGRSAIENWFKKRLQNHIHEQNKEAARLKNELDKDVELLKGGLSREVEILKGRINAQADRRLRLHQYEFEALPRLWELLDKAFSATAAVAFSFDRIQDLSGSREEELRRYAVEHDYTESETAFLLNETDKSKAILRINKVRRANAARRAMWKLGSFNRRNAIFWPEEITSEVNAIIDEITEVLVWSDMEDKRGIDAHQMDRTLKTVGNFTDARRPRLEKAQNLVRERLNIDVLAGEKADRTELNISAAR